jgi:hypothetical protein
MTRWQDVTVTASYNDRMSLWLNVALPEVKLAGCHNCMMSQWLELRWKVVTMAEYHSGSMPLWEFVMVAGCSRYTRNESHGGRMSC